MSRPFEVRTPELGYHRDALFAVELLDALTLSRLSTGITVVAEGLRARPIVNAGGLFVWLRQDISGLRKLTIDPRTLPYEMVERDPSQLQLPPVPRPLTTIELPPRLDYPFPPGVTGARGTLVEDLADRVPVANAEVRLRWLDDDGATWRDAPILSHTDEDGDFVSALRLTPADVPLLDASGAMTVRLWARRDGATGRRSVDLKLPQGRVADPATLPALTFAWDELQP